MKKIIFFIFLFFLGFSKASYALLVCPNPMGSSHEPMGTDWCDAARPGEPSRYERDILCFVEPLSRPVMPVDHEVVGGNLCALSKFRNADVVRAVVSYSISYSLDSDPSVSRMENVDLRTEHHDIYTTSELMVTSLNLPRPGLYTVTVRVRLLNFMGGGFQEDIVMTRHVLRLDRSRLSVVGGRPSGVAMSSCMAGDTNCFRFEEGSVEMRGTEIIHNVRVASQPNQKMDRVDLCIGTSMMDSNPADAGSVTVTGTNTITDASFFPSRVVTVNASCDRTGGSCQFVHRPALMTPVFCAGGIIVPVILGDGQNAIRLHLSNAVDDHETLVVQPFNVDLKGPPLDVNFYRNEDSREPLINVDGKVLLPTEANMESVLVDVVARRSARGAPENLSGSLSCDFDDTPPCGNSPVCIQRQNESGNGQAMCASIGVDGLTHYRARLFNVNFPLNTVTIKAKDSLQNITTETHAFAYGFVKPLFTQTKTGELTFSPSKSLVEGGVGGFLPGSFVTGEELRANLETIVNSRKFKTETFPKLLDPVKPSHEEADCLRGIQEEEQCQLTRLTGENDDYYGGPLGSVAAIKIACGDSCADGEIGRISVPSLQLLSGNKIRLQLRIQGLHVPGDLYFAQFKDADGDGLEDTRDDDDDDNDGILDADDTDDDGDGIPDTQDQAVDFGIDPDFGPSDSPFFLPLNMTIRDLALNLDATVSYNRSGKMQLNIVHAPGRGLVEALPDDRFLLTPNCARKHAVGLYETVRDEHGRNVQRLVQYSDEMMEACRGIERLNGTRLLDGFNRQLQGTNKQFQCTFNAILRCSVPKRLETQLNKYDNKKVTDLSVDLFSRKFHMDLFSQLAKTRLQIDPSGVGFSASGLLAPAGVGRTGDTAAFDAIRFMNNLPARFKNNKFGPLAAVDDSCNDRDTSRVCDARTRPIAVASDLGGDMNVALKEEMINALLQAVGVEAWELARQEDDLTDRSSSALDLTTLKFRNDFDLGIPEIGGGPCVAKNGRVVPSDTSWECFPFPLNVENIFGATTLGYVDFNGDGVPGDPTDKNTLLAMRNRLNPFIPPVVRIVNVFPIGPQAALAELEIGIGDAEMQVFEEEIISRDPMTGRVRETRIKNWCDGTRYPNVSPECQDPRGYKVPIASFGVSGRVSVSLLISAREDGILRLEGGITSRENSLGQLELNSEKTYIRVTTRQNNTIVPDTNLSSSLESKINGTMLPSYLFGSPRAIHINLPTSLPITPSFCDRFGSAGSAFETLCGCFDHHYSDYDGNSCSSSRRVRDLWDNLGLQDFDVTGISLTNSMIDATAEEVFGPTRYLTVQTGVHVETVRR